MRKLFIVALIVMACGGEKQRSASPAELYAGTWEGRSTRSGADTSLVFTMQMTAGAEGTLSGTLAFSGLSTPALEVRTIEVSDSMIVFEMGPYQSPTANTEVITRSEGRVAGDSLWGAYVMLPTRGGGVVPDMSTAQWKNAEMNPAQGSEPIRGTFVATRRHTTP